MYVSTEQDTLTSSGGRSVMSLVVTAAALGLGPKTQVYNYMLSNKSVWLSWY